MTIKTKTQEKKEKAMAKYDYQCINFDCCDIDCYHKTYHKFSEKCIDDPCLKNWKASICEPGKTVNFIIETLVYWNCPICHEKNEVSGEDALYLRVTCGCCETDFIPFGVEYVN